MAKNNPLFVDSTLLHGDRIATQIELTKILLYEGESVAVVITNHLSEAQNMTMKPTEEGNYQARVWLSHQKSISYRFVISKGSRVLLQSADYQVRAQYAILAEWEPVLERSLPQEAPATPASDSTTPWIADYSKNAGSLIEKWGL